jgi:hypothetical protein
MSSTGTRWHSLRDHLRAVVELEHHKSLRRCPPADVQAMCKPWRNDVRGCAIHAGFLVETFQLCPAAEEEGVYRSECGICPQPGASLDHLLPLSLTVEQIRQLSDVSQGRTAYDAYLTRWVKAADELREAARDIAVDAMRELRLEERTAWLQMTLAVVDVLRTLLTPALRVADLETYNALTDFMHQWHNHAIHRWNAPSHHMWCIEHQRPGHLLPILGSTTGTVSYDEQCMMCPLRLAPPPDQAL